MQTITVALDTLKSNPANPRRISDEKFSKLIDSLLSVPKMLSVRPIVVDMDMVIVAGNMRHKALLSIAGMSLEDIRKRLSAIPKYQAMDATEREYVTDFWLDFMDNPQVEVCTTEGMTDAEVREFIIKDNLPFGEWDFDMLANEWDEKELLDWGMDVWDTEWLGDDGDENAAKEDDYEIPDEVTTDIRRGDLFEIGPHRLLCGDSTSPEDWNKLMSGESADIVITDPPYNVDYTGKTKDALKIENDKKSDGDFYEFLLGFYKSLAEHTKRGGGMVRVACRQRGGELPQSNDGGGHSRPPMPDMGEKLNGNGSPGLSLAARTMLIWVERRGGPWLVQRSKTDDSFTVRPAEQERRAPDHEAGPPNSISDG